MRMLCVCIATVYTRFVCDAMRLDVIIGRVVVVLAGGVVVHCLCFACALLVLTSLGRANLSPRRPCQQTIGRQVTICD